MTTWIGNLDVESEWARLLFPGRPHPPLSTAALVRISAAATLLRVFARPGDFIWTPHAVDPERLPVLPGLARPRLASGARPDGPCAWWGRPELAVARLNDRALVLELRAELDCVLPGAREVSSVAEIPAEDGAWVLKAPLSAAGRDRVLGRGAPGPRERKAAEKLLARFGRLTFEPWLDRVEDFGCCGEVGVDGVVSIHPPHRLEVDARGRFLGIAKPAAPPAAPPSAPPADLARIARRVGLRLHADGYRGPFGIDACLHRTGPGRVELQPLLELNARYTFGHVAHALFERVGGDRLVLGTGAPPRHATALLLPGDADSSSAHVSSRALRCLV